MSKPHPTPAPQGERITLRTALTYAGHSHPAGAQLTVDAPTAAWLRRVGAAAASAPTKHTDSTPTAKPKQE